MQISLCYSENRGKIAYFHKMSASGGLAPDSPLGAMPMDHTGARPPDSHSCLLISNDFPPSMGLSVDSAIFAGLTTETDGPRYSVCNSRPHLIKSVSMFMVLRLHYKVSQVL